jgi:hypothetical protein
VNDICRGMLICKRLIGTFPDCIICTRYDYIVMAVGGSGLLHSRSVMCCLYLLVILQLSLIGAKLPYRASSSSPSGGK